LIRVQNVRESPSPCDRIQKEAKTSSGATKEDLQRLQGNPDDSVAVLAAWEEVRRPLPKFDRSISDRSPSMAVAVQGIPRFLGFLEGRLRIPLPEWWAAEMKAARAYDRNWLIFFRNEPLKARSDNSRPRGIGPGFGTVPRIIRDYNQAPGRLIGGDIAVSWTAHKIRLAGDAIPTLAGDSFSGAVLDNRCLVAHFPGVWPIGFELYCIEYRAAKLAWSTRVRLGCSLIAGAKGLGSHNVTLLIRNDVVYLFGMANDLAYIEGVALSDGHSVFAFSTTLMSD